MDFNWFQSLLVGIVMGLTDILPVSSAAHGRLVVKFIGKGSVPALMQFFIHLGIFAALYLNCHPHILKMYRATRLARVPKRKRKRPLDIRSLMDLSLLKTMLLCAVLGVLLRNQISDLITNQIVMAAFFFVNGLLLYIPQFLPSSNKDCRTLSRVEGILMGLGGAMNAVPGLSGVGIALSAASVTGVDRKYGLNMVFLMHLGVSLGLMIMDLVALFTGNTYGLGLPLFLCSLLAAVAAFAAAWGAIRIMRTLAKEQGYAMFSYYCWGIALFTFILTLMA